LHVLSIVRTLLKHKWQILLVWIALSAVAVGIVYNLPVWYKAEAVILVDPQKIPDKYVMSTVNSSLEDRLLSLRKQVLVPDSLQQIVEHFGLYREQRKSMSMEEVLDLMSADTQVELEKGWTRDRPGAFKITYEGSDPRVVAEVTHDIASRFIDKSIRSREDRASQTSAFLTNQLDDARTELAKQEKKVSEYKLLHNGELPEQEGSLGTILSRLQMELQGNQDGTNRAQQEKLMIENSINVAESTLAAMMSMAEQASAGPTSGATVSAAEAPAPQKESEVLEARLDAMLVRYSDDYPEVKRLRAAIAQAHEAESRTDTADGKPAQAAVRGKVASQPAANGSSEAGTSLRVPADVADKLVKERERLANLKSSLALANRELEVRNAERQKILANINTYETRLERLPMREQDMAGITRDYEISKENYKHLLDSKISADMASQMEQQQQAEKLTLLQDARVPTIPFKPVRPLWITVGCLAGLAISLVIGAVREVRAGTVLGEWELPAGVAIMGRVPVIAADGMDAPEAGAGGWLQRRWPVLVLSVLLSLACGLAAVFYRGWIKF
jgi:succinoglycan biosynthesis transport protein ExoP